MNTNAIFTKNSTIVEDWSGGYKLNFNLTSALNVEGWELNFNLPYDISAAYGVDVTNNADGSYTVRGEDGWANLTEGQSIDAVLIVRDNGQQALPLDFYTQYTTSISEPTIDSEPQNIVASADENVVDVVSTPSENLVPTSNSNGMTIDVDNEFYGNLADAIASAEDGDTLELSDKTYYTSGITIDKDITLFGREATIIDGMGTSNTIINLNPGASGATIQNIKITNGNNGIYSYGASNLTLQNLDVYNIGNNQRISSGQNNTGIILNYATGLNLIDSRVSDVSRNGVSIGDTNGATINNLTVENINLAAQHSQSHDAAGIKFFNTNDVVLSNSYFANINANNIWNDTTNKTTIENNTIENVGSVYLEPSFDDNVDISGIYNEKSSNSVVRYNYASAVENFAAYNATEFTTETMSVYDNDFSLEEINTEDYWVDEYAEKLIATTEDPAEADFTLFSEAYLEAIVID